MKVKKLLDVKVIREVSHMCVDFTNENTACLKENFSLDRIDQLVDSVRGYEMLSFLYTYSESHQVQMAKEDKKQLLLYMDVPFVSKGCLSAFEMLVTFARLIKLIL